MLLWTLLAAVTAVSATRVHPGHNRHLCLDVVGTSNPAEVIIGQEVTFNECEPDIRTQNWDVRRGTTHIQLTGTEWCIDLGTHRRGPTPGWNPDNGEGAKLYPCGTLLTAATTFEFNRNKFTLKEKRRGNWCLDVKDGNLGPGNRLQMWECFKHNPNQVFSISDKKKWWH